MYDYIRIGKATDLVVKKDRIIYRLFEMLPGVLAWGTLSAVVIFSFVNPVLIAIFIIVFDVYWLVKTLYLTLHLRIAFAKARANMKIDWQNKLEELSVSEYSLKSLSSWKEIYHLIILPTYQEPYEIIEASIDGLVNDSYPNEKFIVVLAQEEKAGKIHNDHIKSKLEDKFKNTFYKFECVVHPNNIEGEQSGKGANTSWAGKYIKKEFIDKEGISYEKIIVSVLDIDTVVSAHYFGKLTYSFLTTENPLRASYQPIPLFTNNIWEAPALARIAAFSSTFWQTIQQERIENLITFSSHSMPFQAIVDVGFWQTNMVSEDSRIFWQCFLRYDGNYRVVPLFYLVSMDANVAPTFWQTMVNIYKQHRRWGYGAENIPYFLFGFYKNKKIPFKKKYFYSWRILESFWSWATNALMIFLLGWLPLAVGGVEFNQTALSFNMPLLTRWLLTFAMVGMATTAILSIVLLPPRPPNYGRFKHIFMLLQWLLLPFTLIIFGSFPGLEAQTRLMLGKYMGFWVTPKHRSTIQSAPSSASPQDSSSKSDA